MFENKPSGSRLDNRSSAPLANNPAAEPKQRRLMAIALSLLLVALVSVLYHDRDFWFPDTIGAAESDQVETSPVTAQSAPVQAPVTSQRISLEAKPAHRSRAAAKSAAGSAAQSATKSAPAQPSAPIIARTVLPPLEVEVVAGDTHRVVRPGSNSMRVDLQPGAPPQPSSDAVGNADTTAANVTADAAERVEICHPTPHEIVSELRCGRAIPCWRGR
jgi:hypothetical protein